MAEGRFEDLLALDRDVARAAKALAGWRAVLADRPDEAAESDPFDGLRAVAAKSTWQRLGELSPSVADEPLRAALRRWVLALVQARVGGVDDVAWAREAATARGHYEGERHRRVSWREAWRGVASGRSAAEARLWLEAASDAGPQLAPVARLRSERRAEVARRMGLAHAWVPAAPVASVGLGRVRASAARFLEGTDDLSRAVWRESLGAEPGVAAVLHAAVAREAGDGWPARLTPRWIEEQFGAGVRGLPLDLPALPATLGAASFARALALFGYAFRVASAARTLPFSIANDPWFVGAHRLAFVFGALAADPEFHVRALGVGRRIADRQARILARTALLDARLGAARVILGEAEGSPSDAFDDIGARLFGSPLDRRLMGVWPAPRVDEPARWIALLQAPGLRGALRDGFDVDWFRNPRAWAHLVSLGAGPAFEAVDESSLEPGADAAVRSFEHALG